jgi:hypothetical protein
MKMSILVPSRVVVVGLYLLAALSMIDTTVTVRSYGVLNYLVYELALTEIFTIFMVLVTFPAVIRTLVSRHFMVGKGWLLFYCLGLFLTLVGSYIFNNSNEYSFEESLAFFRRAIVSTLLVFALIQGKVKSAAHAHSILLILLGLAVLVGFIVVSGRYVSNSHQYWNEGSRVGKILLPAGLSIGVGGNTMSLYFLIVLLSGWSMVLNCRKYLFLFGSGVVAVSIMVLMLLMTRGVLIVAIPALIIITFMSQKRAKQAIIVSLLVVCFSGLTGPVLVEKMTYSLGNYQINRLNAIIDNSLNKQETLNVRLEQYIEYLPLLIKNLLGYGYQEQYIVSMIQPHSLYLRLLLTSGIIGFFGYIGFLFVNMIFWFRSIKVVNEAYTWAPIAAIVAVGSILFMGWGYDFYNRFYLHLPFMIFIITTSVLCRLAKNETPGRPSPPKIFKPGYIQLYKADGSSIYSGRGL